MGGLMQGGPGFRQKYRPHLREHHRVPVALEQAYAQLFFEEFYLRAQGRLHDGQPLCSAAEMKLFGQGHK